MFLQRVFEENRNAELVEMQRLEEQERRRREEKVGKQTEVDTCIPTCVLYIILYMQHSLT